MVLFGAGVITLNPSPPAIDVVCRSRVEAGEKVAVGRMRGARETLHVSSVLVIPSPLSPTMHQTPLSSFLSGGEGVFHHQPTDAAGSRAWDRRVGSGVRSRHGKLLATQFSSNTRTACSWTIGFSRSVEFNSMRTLASPRLTAVNTMSNDCSPETARPSIASNVTVRPST